MKKYSFTLLLFFFNCQSEPQSNFSYNLKLIESQILHLDSTTSYNSIYFQYTNQNNELWALNTLTNTLYRFNLKNLNLNSNVKLATHGNEGVGRIEGFYHHNNDSIFLYSSKSRLLSLIDVNGRIITKHKLIKEGKDYMVPSIENEMPMKYHLGKIFINCWGSNKEYYKNENYPESLIGVLDLNDSSMNYHIAYPQKYTQGIWGIQAYPMYNVWRSDKTIICSFPIDGSIYLFDVNNYSIKAIQGRSINHQEVYPLSTKDSKIELPNVLAEARHYLSQNTYAYLFANDQYLIRVYLKAMNDESLDNFFKGNQVIQNASLIIFDYEFNIISEVDMPSKDYLFHLSFFANDEFYIPRIDRNIEDILILDKFLIVKN
jgi:hypothetical protein